MRELPIWYAISEAYRSLRKYPQAEMYRGIFDNLLMFFRQDRFDRIHDVDSRDMMDLPDYTQIAS